MLTPQAKLIHLKKRLLVRFGALMICTLLALLSPVVKRGVDKLAFRGPIPTEQCAWNAKRSICGSTVDHPRILAEPARLEAPHTSCQRSRWQFCGWTAMMFKERILFARRQVHRPPSDTPLDLGFEKAPQYRSPDDFRAHLALLVDFASSRSRAIEPVASSGWNPQTGVKTKRQNHLRRANKPKKKKGIRIDSRNHKRWGHLKFRSCPQPS